MSEGAVRYRLADVRAAVRALRSEGISRERVGEREYRRCVLDATRWVTTSGSPRTAPATRKTSPSMLTMEQLRVMQARAREHATRAELERAAALAADVPVCATCDGARYVLVRRVASRPAEPLPCLDCTTAEDRAAMSGVPDRYRSVTFTQYQVTPENRSALNAAVEWEGGSMVFSGPVGTGKTHLACVLLRGAAERQMGGRYWSVPQLLDEIRARFGEKGEQAHAFARRVSDEHLLLLDDLGAERATDWATTELAKLIDYRYQRGLATLVTTNLTLRDVAEYLGERTADRMAEWQWVHVGGQSHRRMVAAVSE